MHFIELWFGISPDAGSGATELLYASAITAAFLVLVGCRYGAKFARDQWNRR